MSKKTKGIPVELSEKAAEIYQKWKGVLERRNQWSDDHIEIVAMAANEYATYWECTQKLQTDGLTMKHSNGTMGQNPLFPIQQASLKNVMTFTNKYGLNLLFEDKVKSGGDDDDSEI